jgi:hypothetical protein
LTSAASRLKTNAARVVPERLGVKESSPGQGKVAFLFFVDAAAPA